VKRRVRAPVRRDRPPVPRTRCRRRSGPIKIHLPGSETYPGDQQIHLPVRKIDLGVRKIYLAVRKTHLPAEKIYLGAPEMNLL
jgi:hypothetical protein